MVGNVLRNYLHVFRKCIDYFEVLGHILVIVVSIIMVDSSDIVHADSKSFHSEVQYAICIHSADILGLILNSVNIDCYFAG